MNNKMKEMEKVEELRAIGETITDFLGEYCKEVLSVEHTDSTKNIMKSICGYICEYFKTGKKGNVGQTEFIAQLVDEIVLDFIGDFEPYLLVLQDQGFILSSKEGILYFEKIIQMAKKIKRWTYSIGCNKESYEDFISCLDTYLMLLGRLNIDEEAKENVVFFKL